MEFELEPLMEKIAEWGALYGMKLIGAIVILIVGRLLAGIVARIVRRLLEKANTDETLTRFLTTLIRMTLLVFVLVAALHTLGVQTASFIAIIGAAGLAVGLALQGSLSNFASGILLIMFRPIKRGDLVETGGTFGLVKEIHIFNTILTTPENKRVIVPNSKVTGDTIVNYSAEGCIRVDMVFGISYGDHIPKAKEILEGILRSHPKVLKEPEPMVAVCELGDSSVNFAVRPHVDPVDYWTVFFDVTEQVKMAFDDKGVSIPFPQRDVHMFQQAG